MKLLLTLCFALTSSFLYANDSFSEDFESFKPQNFTSLKTTYGEWKAPTNQALISNNHAYKGKHALLLLGGKEISSELILKKKLSSEAFLNLSVQRVTGGKPFTFDIYAIDGKKSEKIFTSSTSPLKYENLTNLKLPKGTQILRFMVNTPPNKGIYIDDISLIQSGPMEIRSVVAIQKKVPAITGELSEILTLNIQTAGSDNPPVITGAEFVFEGNKKNVENFEIHAVVNGKNQKLATVPMPHDDKIKVKFDLPLGIDKNEIIVNANIAKNANIKENLDLSCKALFTKGTQPLKIETPAPVGDVRIAHCLRTPKQDNCVCYRIPGIVTTKKGTLLAVYDNRYKGTVDLQADVDVGLSRSTDGGQTWENMKVIMDMGTYGNKPQNENGIGDPTIMYDPVNDVVWVAALWAHGQAGKRTWFASGKGLEPEQTGQFVLVKSEDDGVTWSEPINITKQVKDPSWNLFFQGPGMGITMRNGTLVFPAQFKDQNGSPYSTIIYSKDKGQTWTTGTGAKSNTTEAQVVELDNGALMLNMRDNRGAFRSISTTNDMGKTWNEHPTSRKALIDPVCMGSIIRATSKKDGAKKSILLFSNPNTSNGRHNMGIKYSTDEGQTWSDGYIYDERPCFGYSCLTMIDPETVGVIYEGSSTLYFQAIKLEDIMKQK